jgi:hypothetical protein
MPEAWMDGLAGMLRRAAARWTAGRGVAKWRRAALIGQLASCGWVKTGFPLFLAPAARGCCRGVAWGGLVHIGPEPSAIRPSSRTPQMAISSGTRFGHAHGLRRRPPVPTNPLFAGWRSFGLLFLLDRRSGGWAAARTSTHHGYLARRATADRSYLVVTLMVAVATVTGSGPPVTVIRIG